MKKFEKLFAFAVCLAMVLSSFSGILITSAQTRSNTYKARVIADGDFILSPGDLNADRNFNASDLVLMKKVLFEVIDDARIIDAADCTGDYEANILDAIHLKIHVINIGAARFTYTLEKGKAIITGYEDTISGAVTVPWEINGYPVTEIAEGAFEGCSDITSLLIPSSVVKIGADAFKGCSAVANLALPDSIVNLGDGVFENCSEISNLRLSKNTKGIGAKAFWGCSKLKKVSLPITVAEVGDSAFNGCSSLEFAEVPYETDFGLNVFVGCENLVVKGYYGTGGIDAAINSGVNYDLLDCGHSESIHLYAMNPTCSKAGYTGDKYCIGCGKIVVKGEEIPKDEHIKELKNYVAQTCENNGYSGDYVCTVCKDTVEVGRVIPANNHSFNTVNVKNATCTDDGYSGDKVCGDCGKTVKGEVISATGHSYGALQNNKAATCTSDGYTGDKTCNNCGKVENGVTIPKTGHSYGALQNNKAATCASDGYTGEKVCSSCSYVLKGEIIPARGHSYGTLQGKVEAGCTTDGYTGDKVCATCGDTVKGKIIPKTNHQWAIKDATIVSCTKCSTICSHGNLILNANLLLSCDNCEFIYCGYCGGIGHEESNCSNRCTYCGEVGHKESACAYSTIKKGAKGDVVKKLQTMLNSVNNAGLTVDGDFGSGTETAVKNFQIANGLTADGVVGSKTWTALTEKYGSENSLKIAAGYYNPVSLLQGSSYSITGKITSSKNITSVTVGVYNTNGTATSVIKSATPNAKSYNISALDTSLKFGSLTVGTYYFIVMASDASSTKILVKNKFVVITDVVKALKERALSNWVAPVKKTGFYSVTSGGRYFGASRDSGNRAHAGVDIHYSNGKGIAIYAMESGKVIEYIANFYGGMQAIAVQHADGSIARYCEISTSLRKGDTVTKGQQIATIAKSNIGGDTMLHLEIYMGTATGGLTNSSNTTYDYVPQKNYSRRRDIVDPTFVFDLIS